MAKKNKKGRKGNGTSKSTIETTTDQTSVSDEKFDGLNINEETNDSNEEIEIYEKEEKTEEAKEVGEDEEKEKEEEETNAFDNKFQAAEEENNNDGNDNDEATTDKFVIVDSEDEEDSDCDDNLTLSKLNNTKQEKNTEESKASKLDNVDSNEIVKASGNAINNKLSEFDEANLVSDENIINQNKVSKIEEDKLKKEADNLVESDEVKEVKSDIEQQVYDPEEVSEIKFEIKPEIKAEMKSETNNVELTKTHSIIGQQAYDPEEEEKEENEGPRVSIQEPNLSFISPTPFYKYSENLENIEKLKEVTKNFIFGLAVVDFDHIKGPELTYWLDDELISSFEKNDINNSNKLLDDKIQYYSKIWPYLAFQALPDGVHMFDETFTQFTLCYDELKKSDVELNFDLVELLPSNDIKKINENKTTGEETKEIVKIPDEEENNVNIKDQFINIDLSESNNGNNNNSNNSNNSNKNKNNNNEEELLERVTTRPIISMEDPNEGVVTLFGCACIRQLESSLVKNKNENKDNKDKFDDNMNQFKRSVIQKSVILLTRLPLPIQLREKLSIVTQSWFEQHDFNDCEILKSLYLNISNIYNKNGYLIEDDELYENKNHNNNNNENNENIKGKEIKIIKESDFYMGLNFQEIVFKLRRNLLILFKAIILGNCKILFFSKDLNNLSNAQYCLIGLISNLILDLNDCGFPLIDNFLKSEIIKSKSLKSSDRSSILKFLGLPLRIFGFGSFFQPYLTLQQLSYITNINTKSFIVGSSNDIILEHKNEWFDLIVYLDEKESSLFGNGGCKIEILNKSLKDKINLTWEDKKFIDYVINSVEIHYNKDLKDDNKDNKDNQINEDDINFNNNKSKTVNYNLSIDNGSYNGGDDFIRSQFEDYLIGFLSCCKYDLFLQNHDKKDNQILIEQLKLDLFENDINRFNYKFVEEFRNTQVFKYWNKITEDELFNFFEPKHIGKDIGKDLNNESKFKGGEVIKNWFTKWKEGSGKDEEESNNDNDNNNDKQVNEILEVEKSDKETETNNINNVKLTMNNFGRDVGEFFRRIGDNTSSIINKQAKEAEENGDKREVEDVNKFFTAKEEEKSGSREAAEDEKNNNNEEKDRGEDKSDKEQLEDEVKPDERGDGSSFDNKLRNFFQWRK